MSNTIADAMTLSSTEELNKYLKGKHLLKSKAVFVKVVEWVLFSIFPLLADVLNEYQRRIFAGAVYEHLQAVVTIDSIAKCLNLSRQTVCTGHKEYLKRKAELGSACYSGEKLLNRDDGRIRKSGGGRKPYPQDYVDIIERLGVEGRAYAVFDNASTRIPFTTKKSLATAVSKVVSETFGKAIKVSYKWLNKAMRFFPKFCTFRNL